ncbi:MAG: hypothetical protein JO345_20020 [Streptosporangiaceae bacterium]|nr:hypothetical protein [Streptosporangiaceae bacterium]
MNQDLQVVDQIIISWSERTLTEGRGVGPTVSSIRSKEELAGWERRLLATDWAAAEVGSGVSRPALVYLQFGEEAAVLRKKAVTDPRGRPGSTLAHALVGPVSVLGARVALGLHDWNGWAEEDGDGPDKLDALDSRELSRTASHGYATLDASARNLDPGLLAALFATLLSDPGGRFSFYPAGEGALDPAAAVLCGVLDMFGDATGQAWTFSTCEADEPAAANRPRLVFLSQAPGFSTRVPTGHRVRLGELAWCGQPADDAGKDVLREFGETLAETFAWSPEAIGRLRPRGRVTSTREAIAWARNAEFAPGVPADFGNVLLALGRGRIEPEVQRRLPSTPGALAAGMNALPAETFTRLAHLWGPGTAAATSRPDVAEALGRQVAWRFVSGAGAPAAAVVRSLGVPASAWLEQLERYRSEYGPADLADAVRRVAALGVPELDAELGQILAGMPADELLVLADECAADLPELSVRLLRVVTGRDPLPEGERRACRSQLDQRAFLVRAVERCYPNDPRGESEMLRRLLSVIVVPGLHEPRNLDRLLARVCDIRTAPLLHALAGAVPPGMRERVLLVAGNVWFQDNGLLPLDVAPTPPADVKPPPPAEQAAVPVAPDAAQSHPRHEAPRESLWTRLLRSLRLRRSL